MIVVVSTGRNAPTKQRCIDSVAAQALPETYEHQYIEAGDQDPVLGALQNRASVIAKLDPADIVVVLDGDDWFAHSRVLERIAKEYEDPACWLTYGSFEMADGRPSCEQFRTAYAADADYRKDHWRASHLMTYRAALFQHLGPAELQREDGEWRCLAGDQASMLPMLEMAGPEHIRFIPDILVIYNYGSSFEHTAAAAGLEAERMASREIRALPPRARLVTL